MKKTRKSIEQILGGIKDGNHRKEVELKLQDTAMEREKKINEASSQKEIEKAEINRIKEDSVNLLIHRSRMPRKFGLQPAFIPTGLSTKNPVTSLIKINKDATFPEKPFHYPLAALVSKVTVVGLVYVDSPEDDTYRLVIGLTRCNPSDEYRRRKAVVEALHHIEKWEHAFNDKEAAQTYTVGNGDMFTILEINGLRKKMLYNTFTSIAKDLVLEYERVTIQPIQGEQYITKKGYSYVGAGDTVLYIGNR